MGECHQYPQPIGSRIFCRDCGHLGLGLVFGALGFVPLVYLDSAGIPEVGPVSRRVRLGLVIIFAGSMGLLFVVGLLSLAAQPQFRTRFDFAGPSGGGISDRTAQALLSLQVPLQVTAFLIPEQGNWIVNGSAVYPRAFSLMETLLEDARIRANGRLQVTYLRASSTPVELDGQQRRLERQPGETLFLEIGTKRQVLRFNELFSVQETIAARPARLLKQRLDMALGDAVLRLAQDQLLRVAVSGLARKGAASQPSALTPLMHLLEGEGLEATLVTSIPKPNADFDLLIVPGQGEPFLPADAAAIQAWVQARAPLLLALGPSSSPAVAHFWNPLLADLGVQILPGLVCQSSRGGFGMVQCASLEIPAARLAQTHPITSDLRLADRTLFWDGTRPLALAPGSPSWSREQLVWMSGKAWVEEESVPDFRPGPGERRGPFPIALACSPWSAKDGQRTLVLGSASLFYDPYLRSRDFLAASFHWLLGQDQNLTGLVDLQTLPFQPDEAMRNRLANFSILFFPGFAFFFGLAMYFRRRR